MPEDALMAWLGNDPLMGSALPGGGLGLVFEKLGPVRHIVFACVKGCQKLRHCGPEGWLQRRAFQRFHQIPIVNRIPLNDRKTSMGWLVKGNTMRLGTSKHSGKVVDT